MQGMTNKIPMKYYYGVEDHSEAGWQEIVLNRPRSLLFDTAMLYHLFGLHIHANVRNFEVLASSFKQFRPGTSAESILGNSEHRSRQVGERRLLEASYLARLQRRCHTQVEIWTAYLTKEKPTKNIWIQ